jgi:plasmid stability protein
VHESGPSGIYFLLVPKPIFGKVRKVYNDRKRPTTMSVSIKDLDENAYRNLKAEAIRHGMKVSDAATEAFRQWVASKRQTRQRDIERMHSAAENMDEIRRSSKIKWSGVEEIRKWRDMRKR